MEGLLAKFKTNLPFQSSIFRYRPWVFFAAMSSSRSDIVTHFVVRTLIYFEALEANLDVLMFLVFHQCFTIVSQVFHQCVTSVSPAFCQCFTRILPVFRQCFARVSSVFHKCFTNVSSACNREPFSGIEIESRQLARGSHLVVS